MKEGDTVNSKGKKAFFGRREIRPKYGQKPREKRGKNRK